MAGVGPESETSVWLLVMKSSSPWQERRVCSDLSTSCVCGVCRAEMEGHQDGAPVPQHQEVSLSPLVRLPGIWGEGGSCSTRVIFSWPMKAEVSPRLCTSTPGESQLQLASTEA